MRGVTLAVLALVIQGCCSSESNLVPMSPTHGLAVATSRHESCAVSGAKDLAEETCKKQGLKAVLGEPQVQYQGAPKAVTTGLDVTSIFTGGRTPGSGIVATDEDYKATVDFTCR